MKNCILFICSLCSTLLLPAQNEFTKWYFGNYAALDFMTNPPTVVNNSAMYAYEGCASIADGAGNLLFYTDGATVWNKQHSIMANGTGLLGSNSSVQSAIIIKYSGNPNLYYIFTNGGVVGLIGGGTVYGLNYSIVDMSLAVGMGSVTVKNVPLYNSLCTEQIHATKHANGADIWIMIHEYNTNNFRAYLLTATGVNTTAVVSSAGTVLTNAFQGSIKFSPAGQKIASVLQYGQGLVELYDFNNSTGVVSNALTLSYGSSTPAYGCEFSPDGTKFYTTSLGNILPTQWDLSAGSDAAIISSSIALNSSWGAFGSMQLAPNGKIYLARGGSLSLSVINNPNVAGMGCNFAEGGQSISVVAVNAPTTINTPVVNSTSWSGLPNSMLISTVVCNISISNLSSFMCTNTGSVGVSGGQGNVNYVWSNGTTTYTTQQVNLSAGQWSVTVTDDANCTAQTVVNVPQNPIVVTPSITANNVGICAGDSVILNASGANTYLWSTGAQTESITVAPNITTQYYVTGTDVNGCSGISIPVSVTVAPPPALSISGSTIYCSAQIVTLTASGAYHYYWQWGSTNAHASSSTIVLKQGVTTQYTLTGTNEYGCKSAEVVTVTIGCVGNEELKIINDDLKIYPTPNNGKFIIETSTENYITITDVSGKIVFEKQFQSGTHNIDLSNFSNGIYFVKFSNGNHKKIVISP